MARAAAAKQPSGAGSFARQGTLDTEQLTAKKRAYARQLFAAFDEDCSGTIDRHEMAKLCARAKIDYRNARKLKVDEWGQVGWDNFDRWFQQYGTEPKNPKHAGAMGGVGVRRKTLEMLISAPIQAELNPDSIPPCSQALKAAFTDGICICGPEIEELKSYFELFDSRKDGSMAQFDLVKLYQHCAGDVLVPDVLQREVLRVWDTFGVADEESGITFSELASFFRWRDNDVLDIVGRAKQYNREAVGVRELVWALLEPREAEMIGEYRILMMSHALSWLSQFAVCASIAIMAVETLPEYTDADGNTGTDTTFWMETSLMIFFTIELITRIIFCPSLKRFSRGWINWIDAITVVTFFSRILLGLNDASSAVTVIRIIRLVRITRGLKLVRHLQGVRLMIVALRRAMLALSWLFVLVFLCSTLMGALIYYAERGDGHFDVSQQRWLRNANSRYGSEGDVIPFESIPACMWWAVVTLTTVGYGDMFPVTPWGKVVAGITMVSGLLVVAYPVTILCNAFDEVYREYLDKRTDLIRRRARQREEQLAQKAKEAEEQAMEDIFSASVRSHSTVYSADGGGHTPRQLSQIHQMSQSSLVGSNREVTSPGGGLPGTVMNRCESPRAQTPQKETASRSPMLRSVQFQSREHRASASLFDSAMLNGSMSARSGALELLQRIATDTAKIPEMLLAVKELQIMVAQTQQQQDAASRKQSRRQSSTFPGFEGTGGRRPSGFEGTGGRRPSVADRVPTPPNATLTS
eukprot:Hpha_TRINITY_DN14705_c0_g1::TRINITY_DN14705_c0_g1_i1::g.102436::m.102436/K04885/KCNB1; potassium voltage-gated channel Shab-related subfamily B member 1